MKKRRKMTQKYTNNKIIDDIIKENKKIKDSRYRFKIPICIDGNCYNIRLTDVKGRIEKGYEFWTSNYSHGKLVNSNHKYAELTGTICLEHLQEHYKKK